MHELLKPITLPIDENYPKPRIHDPVVDDDPDLLQKTERLLKLQQYNVSTANTGLAYLQAVEQEKPDLLLLDVMRPDIRGIEVFKRIRGNRGLLPIFVLLISGMNSESESISEGLETGADGYLNRNTAPGSIRQTPVGSFPLFRG